MKAQFWIGVDFFQNIIFVLFWQTSKTSLILQVLLFYLHVYFLIFMYSLGLDLIQK